MSYRLSYESDSSKKGYCITKNARAIRDNKVTLVARFFYFTFPKQKSRRYEISKTYDNSIRRCRRRNRCPDRTSTSDVCSDRSRTEIRPRYNSGSLGDSPEAKEERYTCRRGSEKGGPPSGKTTTLQRCVQRRGGKTRSLANRDSRIRPRRRDNPNRRRTATLSECRARCRTRNRSMGRLRQETKQRGAHGDEERSSDVAYRAQIERKRR